MKKNNIPSLLTSFAVIAVSAFVIQGSASGIYRMKTYEHTVPSDYVGVIVGESIINDVMHSSGVLEPGETRVARGTEVVHVPVGQVSKTIGSIWTNNRAGEFQPLAITFKYEVTDAKRLVEKFGSRWVNAGLMMSAMDAMHSIEAKHGVFYLHDSLDVDREKVALDVESEINAALTKRGVALKIGQTILMQDSGYGKIRSTLGRDRGLSKGGGGFFAPPRSSFYP